MSLDTRVELWNESEIITNSCFLALPIKVIPIFRSKKISFVINHDYNPEPPHHFVIKMRENIRETKVFM